MYPTLFRKAQIMQWKQIFLLPEFALYTEQVVKISTTKKGVPVLATAIPGQNDKVLYYSLTLPRM